MNEHMNTEENIEQEVLTEENIERFGEEDILIEDFDGRSFEPKKKKPSMGFALLGAGIAFVTVDGFIVPLFKGGLPAVGQHWKKVGKTFGIGRKKAILEEEPVEKIDEADVEEYEPEHSAKGDKK